jgi:hypothetical protein
MTNPPEGLFTMFDNAQMLELIERALDSQPFCQVCSAPTTIEDDHGRLWLTCSATLQPAGIIARMTHAILPHERRLVVDLGEAVAA